MTPDEPLTMTSREIAELTGKEHVAILFDVREMLHKLEIGDKDFLCSYLSEQNKALPMYALPKALTITLVSGYDVVRRHKIVPRCGWSWRGIKSEPTDRERLDENYSHLGEDWR